MEGEAELDIARVAPIAVYRDLVGGTAHDGERNAAGRAIEVVVGCDGRECRNARAGVNSEKGVEVAAKRVDGEGPGRGRGPGPPKRMASGIAGMVGLADFLAGSGAVAGGADAVTAEGGPVGEIGVRDGAGATSTLGACGGGGAGAISGDDPEGRGGAGDGGEIVIGRRRDVAEQGGTGEGRGGVPVDIVGGGAGSGGPGDANTVTEGIIGGGETSRRRGRRGRGLEGELEFHTPGSSGETIDSDLVFRPGSDGEGDAARAVTPGIVVGSARGEGSEAASGVDSEEGVERRSDRVDREATRRGSDPSPPERFSARIPRVVGFAAFLGGCRARGRDGRARSGEKGAVSEIVVRHRGGAEARVRPGRVEGATRAVLRNNPVVVGRARDGGGIVEGEGGSIPEQGGGGECRRGVTAHVIGGGPGAGGPFDADKVAEGSVARRDRGGRRGQRGRGGEGEIEIHRSRSPSIAIDGDGVGGAGGHLDDATAREIATRVVVGSSHGQGGDTAAVVDAEDGVEAAPHGIHGKGAGGRGGPAPPKGFAPDIPRMIGLARLFAGGGIRGGDSATGSRQRGAVGKGVVAGRRGPPESRVGGGESAQSVEVRGFHLVEIGISHRGGEIVEGGRGGRAEGLCCGRIVDERAEDFISRRGNGGVPSDPDAVGEGAVGGGDAGRCRGS